MLFIKLFFSKKGWIRVEQATRSKKKSYVSMHTCREDTEGEMTEVQHDIILFLSWNWSCLEHFQL